MNIYETKNVSIALFGKCFPHCAERFRVESTRVGRGQGYGERLYGIRLD